MSVPPVEPLWEKTIPSPAPPNIPPISMHELVFSSRDDGIVHEDWAEGIDEDGHYGNAYYRAQYKLFRQCFVGKNEQCHVHKPKHHARWKAESIVEQ